MIIGIIRIMVINGDYLSQKRRLTQKAETGARFHGRALRGGIPQIVLVALAASLVSWNPYNL